MKRFLVAIFSLWIFSDVASAQIFRPRRESPKASSQKSKSNSKPTCPMDSSYEKYSNLSPDFRIRSGYSRNNDDAPEGSYETAVFDFELIGRWDEKEKAYCLAVLVESFLIEEWENASRWSSQFYLSSPSLMELDVKQKRWTNVVNGDLVLPPVPLLAREHAVSQASYLKNKKYDYQSDLDDLIHLIQDKKTKDFKKASLVAYLNLGWFKPGFYLGRNFLQRPTSKSGQNPSFENTDPASYVTVRHTLEWRVSLGEDGKILEPRKVLFVQSANSNQVDESRSPADFTNYMKLVTPVWHNQVVTIENGSKELKKHVAGLMWKDLVLKRDLYEDFSSEDEKEANKSTYIRYNMLLEMQSKQSLNWGETIGRLPRKANKNNGTNFKN